MAATPPAAGRPGRQLIALGVVSVFLFGMMLFSGVGGMSWTERLEPRLGIDLVGGTRVTLTAVTEEGETPSEDSLELARQIIESRVNALGVEEAEVVSEGDNRIVVTVAGEPESDLGSVGDPAELLFRKVIDSRVDFGAAPPQPTATPTPGPQGTPSPGGTPDPAVTGPPSPAPTAGGQGGGQDAGPAGGGQGGQATPDPTATPTADPSPDPTPAPEPTASAPPEIRGIPSEEDRRASVEEKIPFEAMQAALAMADPATQPQDGSAPDQAAVAPFAELTGPEVAVLPALVQYYVPTITCQQLNARPAGSISDPDEIAVGCDESGFQKLLMDVAKVHGTDVDDASAVLQGGTTQWEVSIQFTGDGQDRWTELTREATQNAQAAPFDAANLRTNLSADPAAGEWSFDESEEALAANNRYQPVVEEGASAPSVACAPAAVGDEGNCLVATVLDIRSVSTPQIRQVITGDARVTGDFSADDAQLLASQLRFGALPLTFQEEEGQSISATLGVEYLRAGLLAAAIGVGLVLLYVFFYYRVLGIVIFGSLVASSALTYAALVVLGRGIGYTLTLAGISGFIVAVGIAADSFVIYFERLKDEIRDGRTARSAVPRAWVRARRTIITANVVTLMAALVLYLLSAGQVRGFAFALGLATVLDLLIVFTFRHPMMTLLARTRAFLSPQMSGLGRALELDKQQAAGAAAARLREREA